MSSHPSSTERPAEGHTDGNTPPSDATLRYSHMVRTRVIDTAIMLMQRAGCICSQVADDTGCTISVVNPPDMPDKHARMVAAATDSPE